MAVAVLVAKGRTDAEEVPEEVMLVGGGARGDFDGGGPGRLEIGGGDALVGG